MSKLEEKISEWRKQLLATGIKTPVPLEELEAHLREEIEQLIKSGRNEVEAFEISVQRIGQAQPLQDEFKKAEMEKMVRMAERALRFMFALLSLFALGLAGGLLSKVGNFSQCTSSQLISCLIATAIFPLPIWCVRRTWRFFPAIHSERTRGAICCMGFVVLMVWMNVVLRAIPPYFDFNMGQLIVVFCWAMLVPMGFWAGVAFGIEVAAQKKLEAAVR